MFDYKYIFDKTADALIIGDRSVAAWGTRRRSSPSRI